MPTYKPYSIRKIGNNIFFVIPKDYRGIDFVLPMVNEELQSKKFTGHVVFDLLLSNGNNSRRFFDAFFDGFTIIQSTLVKMSPAPEDYHRITNQFIKSHPDILSQGILRSSDIQKFRSMLNIPE